MENSTKARPRDILWRLRREASVEINELGSVEELIVDLLQERQESLGSDSDAIFGLMAAVHTARQILFGALEAAGGPTPDDDE